MDKTLIMDAVTEALKARLPGWSVQTDRVRQEEGFKAPAALVQYVTSLQDDAGKLLVHVTDFFLISLYLKPDARGDGDRSSAARWASQVMSLFSRTHFKVADRCLALQASGGGMDITSKGAIAYIDLQTAYYEDRERDEEQFDTILNIHTSVIPTRDN